MADTTTTNYGLTKPEIGASEDSWGTKLNANLDTLDTTIKAVSDAADAAQGTADDALVASNSLSDIASAADGRTNLGLAIGSDVQAYSGSLNSFAGVTFGSGKMAYTTGTNTWAALDSTSYGRSLLGAADAAALRTLADLGGLATVDILDEDDFASDSATRPSSQRATAAYIATLPFTKSYASAAQSVSSGSLITLPHGLGARPKVVSLLAQFTSATNGYSPGDIAMINSGYEFPSSSSASRGFAVVLTATEIKVRCSNSGGVGMVDFSDGGRGQVSMSDMKLIVEAWA